MAKLESLIVDMQLETAELRKGLDEVKKKLEDAAHELEAFEVAKEIFEKVGDVVFEAAEKIGEMVIEGAQAADQMGKMAQSAGIGVEQFGRLTYAANLSHVSNEEFAAALKKLNVNLAEAGAGSVKQATLFRQLGVSIHDASGNARSSGDVIEDLAARFSELQDGPAKAALAVELFGKTGNQLIPFLNEGAEGLKELGDQAERFGLVVDAKTVTAATKFNDNLEAIKKAVEGVAIRVAADLSPSLAALTERFVKSKDAAEDFKTAAEDIAKVVRVLLSGLVLAIETVKVAIAGYLALADVITKFKSLDFSGAVDVAKNFGKQFDDIAEETAQLWEAIWKRVQTGAEKTSDAARKPAQAIFDATKNAEKEAEDLKKLLEGLTTAYSEFNKEHAKAQLELGQKIQGINQGAETKAQSFADIGVKPEVIFERLTAGFDNFNQALQFAVDSEVAQAKKLAEAKEDERIGAFADARAAYVAADALGESAKEGFKAADAFAEAKKKVLEQASTVEGAMKALAGSVLQAIPRLNQLVQAAQQGAQVGGVWGALIAVFVQLLSQTKGFSQILDLVNGLLDQVIGALEPLISGIASVANATRGAAVSFLAPLKGPLQTIGGLLEALAPLLSSLTQPLNDLFKVVDSLGSFMKTGAEPIFLILKLIGTLLKVIAPLLQILMLPLTLLGELFEGLSSALGPVFKDIDTAFSWLANRLDEFGAYVGTLGERIKNSIAGKGFKSDQELANDHNSTEADRAVSSRGKNDDQGLISDVTKDTAASVSDLGDAAKKSTTAFDKLTEAFTNVPEGFKVRLRQFQAQDATGGASGYGEIAFSPNVSIYVSGNLVHENQLLELVEKRQKRKQFNRTGKP